MMGVSPVTGSHESMADGCSDKRFWKRSYCPVWERREGGREGGRERGGREGGREREGREGETTDIKHLQHNCYSYK